MYPAALHKIPTQTADSSQVFERWLLQKQPKMINKMTKSWDRNTISDLETSLSQTGPRFLLLIVVVKDNFSQINIIFLISHLFRKLNFSKWMLLKKSRRVKRIKLVVNTSTTNTYKIYKCCIAPSPYTFAFFSAQWSFVWCQKG